MLLILGLQFVFSDVFATAQGNEMNAQPLHRRTDFRSLSAVASALASGAIPSINHVYADDTTPIFLAVRAALDDALVCEDLLSKGALANTENRCGWTPLHEAASRGKLEVCQCLLSHGASIHACDKANKSTPLWLAASHGFLPVCKLLLDAGALVAELDIAGLSPLAAAARGGHLEVCALLIARGAPVDDVPSGSNRPIALACRWGRSEVRTLLLSHGAESCSMPVAWTQLIEAAANGETRTCEELLAGGAAVDEQDALGRTALFHAVREGHSGVCATLLNHSANPRAINFFNRTVLASCVQPRICKLLLDEGMELHSKAASAEFDILLHKYEQHALRPMIWMLVAHGAPLPTGAATPALEQDFRYFVQAIRDAGWRRRLPAFAAYIAVSGEWWVRG